MEIRNILLFTFGLFLLVAYGCQEKISGCTNASANNYNPLANEDNGTCSYSVTFIKGNSYGGGVIFYVDSTGQHGLIASPSDQSSGVQWFNGTNIITNATGITVGTGLINTSNIVSVQGPGNYAAYLCDTLILNGYDDWYLPTKDELYLLYIEQNLVGGFTNNYYWSSLECSIGFGYPKRFDGVYTSCHSKDSLYAVRAIRSF